MVRWLKTGGDGIRKRIEKRAEQLAAQISSQEKILNQFSEGNLFCSRNGKYFKWYRTDDTGQTYIPKDQREQAEQLALKKYHELVLQDMKNEYAACQAYLEKYKEARGHKLLEKPGYDDLLRSHFLPLSKELELWASEHYEKNENYLENLIHKCASGILVRSKSEAMIASALYRRRIPFRYECALRLHDDQMRDIHLYPDFSIRHPKDGKMYYWEHFGLMDQPGYARKAGIKLQNYIASGIIPTIQLITTYETKEIPLSVDVVEGIVERYFES